MMHRKSYRVDQMRVNETKTLGCYAELNAKSTRDDLASSTKEITTLDCKTKPSEVRCDRRCNRH